MATKRQATAQPSRPTENAVERRSKPSFEREFKGWVNINLTDDMKLGFHAWCEARDLDQEMTWLAKNNYRLSVYWDEYNDTFAASLTCWNKETNQFGYSLSMRGASSLMALWRVIYTHVAITEGDWTFWMTGSKKSDW